MMSNCAFWSASGELIAVHGVETTPPSDARETFGPWASARRLPVGRLVDLSPAFPLSAPGPGWHAVVPAEPKKGRLPKAPDSAAPVATPAPRFDEAARRLLPEVARHELFTVKAWPTWTSSVRLEREEGPEGWFAALLGDSRSTQFLVRLIPHRGRLPSEGWRNMLAWVLKTHAGVRLAALNGLPTPGALAAAPAWEYRVEAGKEFESAGWDVQLLPGRTLLQEWAPGFSAPWEATALLRWVRPSVTPGVEAPSGDLTWAELLGALPVADARLLVQNVLTTLPGGVAQAAALFYDVMTVPGPSGRSLVRHVPQDGLPVALLSTLFSRKAWNELERGKRRLPPEGERWTLRAEALADLDLRLAEGRLEWSPDALALWQALYREPRHRALEAELATWRRHERWNALMTGDHRVAEGLLRGLDVTDAALCLREAPDTRWRRFVTARREAEIREEIGFCQVWEARGELTLERQIDAWRSWDERARALALDETPAEK